MSAARLAPTPRVGALKAGRKPTPEMLKEFRAGSRDAVWQALREMAWPGCSATARELERRSGTPQRTVRSYLACLVAANLARTLPPLRPGAGIRFQLLGDVVPGPTPPRLRPDGGAVTQGSGRDRLWRTMKMLKIFTPLDLAVAASMPRAPVAAGEAEYYVKWLTRAGYLAVARPAVAGKGGRRAAYRFVRNTGPEAPMILRTRCVWDPNLKQPAFVPAPAPSNATEAA
jgi:hypothetical protein